MTAVAAQIRPLFAIVLVAFAGLAGAVGRSVPGVLGPLAICYGLGLAYRPLGFVAAGVFLLLIDRRIP